MPVWAFLYQYMYTIQHTLHPQVDAGLGLPGHQVNSGELDLSLLHLHSSMDDFMDGLGLDDSAIKAEQQAHATGASGA